MHNLSSSDTVTVDDSSNTPHNTSPTGSDIGLHSHNAAPDERRHSRIEPAATPNSVAECDEEKPAVRTRSRESPNPIVPPCGGPPEGGLRAWSTVVGGFCGMFVSFGWISCEFMPLSKCFKLQFTNARI